MPRGRDPDPERLRSVLLLAAGLLAICGVAVALVLRGWAVLAGLFLVGFAVACVRVARDDGGGRWCEQCVTRNRTDAEVCETCGAGLG